jgi:hypothetical protein
MTLFEVVCIHGRTVFRSRERAEAEAQNCALVQVPVGVAAEAQEPVVTVLRAHDYKLAVTTRD